MGRVLIAGMGNVLRRDDGFGVEVAKRLAGRAPLPDSVDVVDIGIDGIHLVHQLMKGYDALLVVDATERGDGPGALQLMEVEVPELSSWPAEERREFLADMHYATPTRALILAKALDILPPRVYLLGCHPGDVSDLGIGLTTAVQRAVDKAVREIERILDSLLEAGHDGKVLPRDASHIPGHPKGTDRQRANPGATGNPPRGEPNHHLLLGERGRDP